MASDRGLQSASAKHLASFTDLMNFKNVTVEQINECLTRVTKLGTESGNRGRDSDGNSARGCLGDASGRESEKFQSEVFRISRNKSSNVRVSQETQRRAHSCLNRKDA